MYIYNSKYLFELLTFKPLEMGPFGGKARPFLHIAFSDLISMRKGKAKKYKYSSYRASFMGNL